MMMDADLLGLGVLVGHHATRVVRELRRQSDSLRAQHLWDAIKAVRAQKQIPAIPRMARYMSRYHGLTKEATQRLLDLAVEDNLVKLENKIGTKGNKNGVEEKAYRLPTPDMLPRERHDWYCFHCHTGGEVVLCSGCHRVYHETCLKEPLSEENEFFCVICKTLQKVPESQNKRERKDLNQLLKLCVRKLREKMSAPLLARDPPQVAAKSVFEPSDTKPVLNQPNRPPQELLQSPGGNTSSTENGAKKMEDDDTWRARFLLKVQIDFDEMEQKCNTFEYRIAEEFRADAQLIVHNTVIYHGVHSNMADLARQMFRDCTYDLKDIQLCRDCYRYSCDKLDKFWFCKPCRPFHELVYAKQKGFPYWPAKVMRTSSDGMHDVRFFGGYHQRALVERHHIRPITINIHTLQVKRTSLWNKACDELRRHQEFLSRVKTNPDFLKEPYGNPFESEELRAQFNAATLVGGLDDFDEKSNMDAQESEEDEEYDDLADHPSMRPPRDTPPPKDESLTSPIQIIPPKLTSPFASPSPPVLGIEIGVSEPKKKKPGRPKKSKREEQPENFVSSSCQESTQSVHVAVQTPSKLLRNLVEGATGIAISKKAMEKEFKQFAEKMRSDFDQEKKRAVNVATRSLERDLERLKGDHATELEELTEKQKQEISDIKKKQWCYNCEAEAIYWCCWNTAYCTIECQQEHWHKEHKKMCRRKR